MGVMIFNCGFIAILQMGSFVNDVRRTVSSESWMIYSTEQLVSYGYKTQFAFDIILAEQSRDLVIRTQIFRILALLPVDKGKYYDCAMSELTQEYATLRVNAIALLTEIGNPRCLPALSVMIWDPNDTIVLNSSKAISRIGNDSTVTVFDIWLRKAPKRNDDFLGKHIIKCRQDLQARLEKEEAERKKADPPKK